MTTLFIDSLVKFLPHFIQRVVIIVETAGNGSISYQEIIANLKVGLVGDHVALLQVWVCFHTFLLDVKSSSLKIDLLLILKQNLLVINLVLLLNMHLLFYCIFVVNASISDLSVWQI